MNTSKQLNGISSRLTELIEDLERILDYIDNTELYNEIDNNVKSQLENVQSHLDIAIDDIEDGMYENPPADEEEIEEWD
jgi:tRNA U34 5-carboxymethylaminomethyl modifying GTPase MnmE/TrmE